MQKFWQWCTKVPVSEMSQRVTMVAMLCDGFSSQQNLEALIKHVPRIMHCVTRLRAWNVKSDRNTIAEAIKQSFALGLFTACESGHGALRVGESESINGLKNIRCLVHLLRTSNCEIVAFGNRNHIRDSTQPAIVPAKGKGKALDQEIAQTCNDHRACEVSAWSEIQTLFFFWAKTLVNIKLQTLLRSF